MEDGFKRLSITEMGETLRVSKVAGDYAEGGEMRAFMGADFFPGSPNQSALERPAVIALSAYHDAGRDGGGYDRNEAVERLSRAMRIVVVNQIDVEGGGQSDVQRAHGILKTLALVERMEARADGVPFDPSSDLVAGLLETSKVDAELVPRDDANRFAVGMADMMEDPVATRMLREATSQIGMGDEELAATRAGSLLARFDAQTGHPTKEEETLGSTISDLGLKGAIETEAAPSLVPADLGR